MVGSSGSRNGVIAAQGCSGDRGVCGGAKVWREGLLGWDVLVVCGSGMERL